MNNFTNRLIWETSIKQLSQKDIAQSYAGAIIFDKDANWTKINNAIIKRWSLSGLLNVKASAWKLIENRSNKNACNQQSPNQ